MRMSRRSWAGGGLAGGLAELADLVLPGECAGCGLPGAGVCGDCRAALAAPPVRCRPTSWPQAPPTWAGSAYDGVVQRLVVAWKDRSRHDVTQHLSGALARAVVEALAEVGRPGDASRPGGVLLVPVPSSRASRARRGQDVVHALALRAAGRVRAAAGPGGDRTAGSPPAALQVRVVPALRLARAVADQAGLGRGERARNLDGALEVRGSAFRQVAGRVCVVVDDVLTTGATAREAARALAAAGAVTSAVATASATPLRGPREPAGGHCPLPGDLADTPRGPCSPVGRDGPFTWVPEAPTWGSSCGNHPVAGC